MKKRIEDFAKLENEGADTLPSAERRRFLRLGLTVTGVFAGGTVLSLTSSRPARGALVGGEMLRKDPYKPHYSMVIREDRCIDCQRCMDACVKTNDVPEYGYRTTILERELEVGPGEKQREFMPVLCNHCNRPPCVRVCPTKATYKDEKTGIVMMHYEKCIGCKTCMAACPYNARYFNEEKRAIDKCNFCFDTRLSKGEKLTACAAACPADVRIFGDIADPDSRVYKLVHEPTRVVWVLRPETGAMPNVFYTKG
ncbi:4Fe-4S dicluster domain-containing protein [Dissulfurirhabdus thermomarina]|uniref:4Fe-4S dicluster domain-containing protein n=1 Tax=Dissulfurirhabdus thermomarina TaxID=1765737 RepID=A0A6N9TLX4_DISTH|nr:4Fe-4S dicluster domain-containing protein [Dissulfurirhabdus thermomarina]NDY42038.1 4Fe-4S dicluster domain-containing protein [Dissulfurirhabdus thermomarina]NMX22330.1 4Fe-4S dicluster domain-containing protein [Dissulfurirhabdus thermomarina]